MSDKLREALGTVTISRKAFDFLMGSEPLDGVGFGDLHRTRKGRFWWRSYISEESAALTAKTSPDAVNGWLPISSAPKDCEIDLWGTFSARNKSERIPDCKWLHDANGPGWKTRGENGWQDLAGVSFRATHWRPLPAPPSFNGERDDG